jgi:hypothetical protein
MLVHEWDLNTAFRDRRRAADAPWESLDNSENGDEPAIEYEIRSEREGHNRVAKESELTPARTVRQLGDGDVHQRCALLRPCFRSGFANVFAQQFFSVNL